ncbi:MULTISPECIES: glycosyltransferase family 2 protein [Streptococcus]|uniref:Glycosyltransferase n=1 Tax=Streptococcus caledonicus TaxID=2614158 RepID=A0ABW0UDN9_9STRE|nr:glycosyltransferase family 2 protein [Streptococcus sp. S784/96/1]
MDKKKLSFVIPCYFSEQTLADVVETVIAEFHTKYDIELVLVNDGSTDNTFRVIQDLCQKYSFIKGINLAKNFGQDGARMAGYRYCTGDYIISLDDDGQNPPAEAHKLIAKLEEGYDVVFGEYLVKKHSWFKNFGSKVNDKMANVVIGKPQDLRLCSYFIMTSFVAKEIVKYDGAFPYVWGLILRSTNRIANQIIEHREREVGETTYTFAKLLGLWLNGFTAFSVIPLRFASLLGAVFALLGFLFVTYILISMLFFGISTQGWASLMSVLLITGGVLMMMIGLLGEYVGRIYLNGNKAPQFVIREYISNEE